MQDSFFQLNSDLEIEALRERYRIDARVQVRNVLTRDSANRIADLMLKYTPWGMAAHSTETGPIALRAQQLRNQSTDEAKALHAKVTATLRGDGYGYLFGSYPMVEAYLGRWNPDSPHDLLLEHINDAPFLQLVREITEIPELKKADAQATLYAPGHFLAQHDDSHMSKGWRVAYVLNLCPLEWRPEWGGYLDFLSADGDVICGWKPRFNCLNLFKVPQSHQVTFVPPFAPTSRLAITGWFRDR